MALLEQAHAALAGQACGLGGGESCCGDLSRSEFCLNDFFVLRLDLLEQAHAALAGQACALVGKSLVVGEVPVLSFA